MAEFNIRLFSYRRLEQKEWIKVRELAWSNIESAALVMADKKAWKGYNNKLKYMPLDSDKKTEDKEVRERRDNAIKQALERYKEEKAKSKK